MAMGVLLRRNHRRVAANMTEPSAGLPACLVCLSVCLSASLVGHCTAGDMEKRLERFEAGGIGRLSGSARGKGIAICSLGQAARRWRGTRRPAVLHREHEGTRHRGKEPAVRAWYAVSQAKWTTAKSYPVHAQPFPGIACACNCTCSSFSNFTLGLGSGQESLIRRREARTWTR